MRLVLHVTDSHRTVMALGAHIGIVWRPTDAVRVIRPPSLTKFNVAVTTIPACQAALVARQSVSRRASGSFPPPRVPAKSHVILNRIERRDGEIRHYMPTSFGSTTGSLNGRPNHACPDSEEYDNRTRDFEKSG
jgi:hypothetical protein